MGNIITNRQNEDTSINYLAAQRQIYNEVKGLDGVVILFSVFLPLLFAILQLVIKDNAILNTTSYGLAIISMFVAHCLYSYTAKKREAAAEIQQYFDVYVYQMPWDRKLFGIKKDITYIVAEKSKLLLKKSEEIDKLLDWYTPSVSSVDMVKGIWMCQKENFYWDVNLRKRFKLFCTIIIGALVIVIFGLGVVNNEPVGTLLYRFAFVIPMLQWLFETIKQLNNDIENLEELNRLINSPNIKEMDDLQEIQSKIYSHRKSCYAIPNKFYEKYKDNDEDVAHRVALMDSNDKELVE